MAESIRKEPTTEQRRKAMEWGVQLASAHTALNYPGKAAVLFATEIADYLANGATAETK